ncbi:TPA: hypothetical protein N0F65_008134 [Lagenidium giganteum]|uniref:Uncharacterized protein n=1 Tax=Lagenidium giganteum TaxID=4803 RepID=A0AAV2YKQ4_9STRA|nr:TPA: hypothetical protein N0F65_008134 [Lagenidium giganteum]
MLYQLAKGGIKWNKFAKTLKNSYRLLELDIEEVIAILAKLKKIDNVKDISVILCVDGLQNDGSKICDFYNVLAAICRFMTSSTAFAVCVCSATVQSPLRAVVPGSLQKRYLTTQRTVKMLAAILSRRPYRLFEPIGRTNMTVDELGRFGLFRWTCEGRLECAFILLMMLMRKLPKKRGEVDSFDEHLTRSVVVWQRFEQYVAFYCRVKSIAYCETPVELSTFHTGARFGSVNGILIEELQPRTVVKLYTNMIQNLASKTRRFSQIMMVASMCQR